MLSRTEIAQVNATLDQIEGSERHKILAELMLNRDAALETANHLLAVLALALGDSDYQQVEQWVFAQEPTPAMLEAAASVVNRMISQRIASA